MARHRRTPPPLPAAPRLQPAWAGARWGTIRRIVIALAVVVAVGVAFIDPQQLLATGSAFWWWLGLGIGAAGLASSLRALGLPVDVVIDAERRRAEAAAAERTTLPPARRARDRENREKKRVAGRRTWWAAAEIVGVRALGDVACVVAVIALVTAVRVAVAVAGTAWTAELLQALVMAPASGFFVFFSFLITGWLMVAAVLGLARARERRGTGAPAPASAWWIFGAVATLAIAIAATVAVGLSDTATTTADGGEAIAQFLFGALPLQHPWQHVALWLARLGAYGFVVCVVGVIVARMRQGRRA